MPPRVFAVAVAAFVLCSAAFALTVPTGSNVGEAQEPAENSSCLTAPEREALYSPQPVGSYEGFGASLRVRAITGDAIVRGRISDPTDDWGGIEILRQLTGSTAIGGFTLETRDPILPAVIANTEFLAIVNSTLRGGFTVAPESFFFACDGVDQVSTLADRERSPAKDSATLDDLERGLRALVRPDAVSSTRQTDNNEVAFDLTAHDGTRVALLAPEVLAGDFTAWFSPVHSADPPIIVRTDHFTATVEAERCGSFRHLRDERNAMINRNCFGPFQTKTRFAPTMVSNDLHGLRIRLIEPAAWLDETPLQRVSVFGSIQPHRFGPVAHDSVPLVITDTMDVLEARSPDSLELVWKRVLPGGSELLTVAGQAPNPVLVYGSDSLRVIAVNASDGSTAWQRIGLMPRSQGSRVIVSTVGGREAFWVGELDPATGEEIWKTQLDLPPTTSANLAVFEDSGVASLELWDGAETGGDTKEYLIVDLESGQIRWRAPLAVNTALWFESALAMSFGLGQVTGIDAFTGERIWSHEGEVVARPQDGLVQLNGGRMVDVATGLIIGPNGDRPLTESTPSR
ncbi:MAG: PQQ-binding-like beta-propeller repeat protein [Acidimicrobiales bacterium]